MWKLHTHQYLIKRRSGSIIISRSPVCFKFNFYQQTSQRLFILCLVYICNYPSYYLICYHLTEQQQVEKSIVSSVLHYAHKSSGVFSFSVIGATGVVSQCMQRLALQRTTIALDYRAATTAMVGIHTIVDNSTCNTNNQSSG